MCRRSVMTWKRLDEDDETAARQDHARL